jgi:hypothetical protein
MRDVVDRSVTAVTGAPVTGSTTDGAHPSLDWGFQPSSERHIYRSLNSPLNLSNYAQEEEKLRKLYDQARAQGNRKKKKEYKEKLAELNRLRKYSQDETEESKD